VNGTKNINKGYFSQVVCRLRNRIKNCSLIKRFSFENCGMNPVEIVG
jgi:hypothetical protein